jgi:endonuclease YncB( thermonuclease family)
MVATMSWVFDGDTIKLSNGTRVRYAGVNTPEIAHEGRPAEPFANEAYMFNKRLTMGNRVRIQIDKEKYDQYGRLLAYVFLPDGTFVNGALVEKGLAMVYTTPPNVRYDQDLLTLQRRAMRERVGLWASADPGKEPFYIGNKRSRRFHSPSCHLGQKTGRRNKVIYRNRLEAFYDGLSPCKKCNP